MRWPDWLNDVWAKSADKGAGGQPESLAQHTWDVLARLAGLIRLRPSLPEAVDSPHLWHILFWAAFLHDFGKACSGFQALLRGGPPWPHRHEVLSLAFLDWIIADMEPVEQAWMAAAIVSHHKDAEDIEVLYDPPDHPEHDELIHRVAEIDGITLRGLWRWLDECRASWVTELGLAESGIWVPPLLKEEKAIEMVRLHGVQRIRHWLRAYSRLCRDLDWTDEQRPIVGTIAMRGYLISSDHTASAHVATSTPAVMDAEKVLADRGLAWGSLYRHQKEAHELAGSALLTAPTGSGKTEAALLWAARQASSRDGLPRLFYTLPYQASMNAMYLRLRSSLGDCVGLQHGRSLLAFYRMMLDPRYGPEHAAAQARHARDLARLNHNPIRVFSPYQMLKAMYRLKGYEALLADYQGAAFIFDEIHAYEPERLALILKTVEYLAGSFQARFFFMSATFPSLIKDKLCECLGSVGEIEAEPSLFGRFTRHRLHRLDGELLSKDGLGRIVSDARAGRSVLVVCNLVARAQEAYKYLNDTLAPSGIRVELLHGRFCMRDRSAKEKLVREATGSASEQRQPIVLVATQVVEVSLDIDLDTIYTDPAPLDALVQRFGRINRRRRQKNLAPVHVFGQPADGQGIYADALVTGTLSVLDREQGNPIDEQAVGRWVDEIYSGEPALEWQHKYDHAAAEFEATCIRDMRAFQADDYLRDQFYRAFDGIEVIPESLYDQYTILLEEERILANELLVPIRWGQYHALLNRGRMLPGDGRMPPVARAWYDAEVGLDFDRNPFGDDLWG